MLKARNLNLHFSISGKKLHAVRGVSFDLSPGEILGLVGESGCGKTALAKALIQLHSPYSTKITGEVYFNEKNLLSLSEKELQRIRGKEIAMIFQDPMTSLNPTLKVGTQITESYLRHHPKASYQEAKTRGLELLNLVGIPNPEERFSQYPHTLSGGTRQRIMIALALVSEPQCLIADEPTTALDVTIQAQILELLKGLQKQLGMSIILITHDLSVVAGFCDKVAVMYSGKIVESASVIDLFRSPRHPYTQRLLEAIPRLNSEKGRPLLPIEGSPPNLFRSFSGCAFCPRCRFATEVCHEKEPELLQVTPNHLRACHATH
jgi:oligopeptide/dipeptide ABC transporter ATP-binding protein